MPQPYAKAMDMQPAVSYIPYAKYSRKQTGNIITLVQFEEGCLLCTTRNLLSENREYTESGNNPVDNSTLLPLISDGEIDAMSSGYEYYSEPISTALLEDICDGSQSHPITNRREACYKIHDCIKRGQMECKEVLLSTQNMGKVLHKLFNAVVNEILQALQIVGEFGSEVSYLIPEPRKFAEAIVLSEDIKKP